MDIVLLERALATLGELLERRGSAHSVAVVGGGSLLLQGLLERPTQDLDVVAVEGPLGLTSARPLPPDLVQAVRHVGAGLGLTEDWLNSGPTALLDLGLPGGFRERLEPRRYGNLRLGLASRFDQIHFKLYAAVDQGPASKHFADLRLIGPARDELLAAARWARQHDPSEAFEGDLRAALSALGVGVRDGDV